MNKEIWTERRIELLREGAEKGMSNSQILTHINENTDDGLKVTSRNAVIGKRNRLGIPPTQQKSGRPKKISTAVSLPKKGPHTSIARLKIRQTNKPLPQEIVAPTPGNNVTLMHLLDGMCKWPVGEFYCGATTENARTSYCDFHKKAASRGVSAQPAKPFYQFSSGRRR